MSNLFVLFYHNHLHSSMLLASISSFHLLFNLILFNLILFFMLILFTFSFSYLPPSCFPSLFVITPPLVLSTARSKTPPTPSMGPQACREPLAEVHQERAELNAYSSIGVPRSLLRLHGREAKYVAESGAQDRP